MQEEKQSTSGMVFPSHSEQNDNTEEITLDYPDPEPYNPRREIRFFRCHLTEAAARACATADVDAFGLAFPNIVALQKGEYSMRERYADYGAVGCVIWIRILVDEKTYRSIGNWFAMLHAAWTIEGSGYR